MKRRRLGPAVLTMLGAVSAAFFLGVASAAEQPPTIDLRDLGQGRYVVEGSFEVEAPAETAWQVLTDYARISTFVSSMSRSELIEDTAGHKVVEQEASAKVFLFSRSVRVVLHVTEEPRAKIRFEDIAGKDFIYYRGSWSIVDKAPDVSVSYRLECQRRFKLPNAIIKNVLRKNARHLLEEVGREITRRKERGTL